ncbi:MAG: STAS domain-containing protein [Phycisphaerae bacterium]|nr:STAS domain-containing protein [Phycisphaerae bacterium]
MSTPHSRIGDCWLFEPIGTIDHDSPLAEEIGRLLDEGRPRIVLDLSSVQMITSAGLGLLVQLTARANSQGARFVLTSPSPFVQGVLQITRLIRFFEIHPSRADAMSAVNA